MTPRNFSGPPPGDHFDRLHILVNRYRLDTGMISDDSSGNKLPSHTIPAANGQMVVAVYQSAHVVPGSR
jgi:hypothetical protein